MSKGTAVMIMRSDVSKARNLTLGGAVVAAIAASACCIGPLVLAVLGIGAAGAFATLTTLRPYILGLTAALLGFGFYLTYRKRPTAEGDTCGCERPKVMRVGRVGLWIASPLVIVLAAAPPILASVSRGHSEPVANGVEQATIHVQGIDCEACAVPLRRALARVGGFRDLSLDVKAQQVTITYEPAPGRLDAYVAAIDALGYEAFLPSKAPR